MMSACSGVISSSVISMSDTWLKNALVFALAKVWQTLIGPGQQWFWPQTVKVWLVVLICCDSNSLCFWYVWIQSHCFDSKFKLIVFLIRVDSKSLFWFKVIVFAFDMHSFKPKLNVLDVDWVLIQAEVLSLILLSLMLNELSQTQAQWSYIIYICIFFLLQCSDKKPIYIY